jgi:hypothetical protein
MISMFVLYLKFGLGHTCVQGHIFVLDLDFWQGQVQKYDLVHMYDPNQKSRSSTKI